MSRFWIGLILGVTLGFLVAQFLFPPAGEPSGQETLALEASPRQRSGEVTDRSTFQAAPLHEPRADTGGQVSRTVDDPLQTFLRSLPRPDELSGDGRITGTIHTSDGQPVPDVTITATPRSSPPGSSLGDDSLATYVQSMAHGEAWRRANRRVTTSDHAGRFTIDNIDDSTQFRVDLVHEGYRFDSRERNTRLFSVRAGRQLDIVAEPVASVTFDVRMPDGSQATSANLAFGSTNSTTNRSWRPASADITMTPGTYSVHATGEEGRLASAQKAVTIGESQPAVTLQLEPVPLIIGSVQGDTASSSYRVHLHPLSESATQSPEVVRDRGDVTWVHEHDGFAFRFKNKPGGRYGLLVTNNDQIVSDLATIDFDGTFLEIVLEVRPPRREDFVSVLVLDPEGRPIRDASISPGVRSERGQSSGGGIRIPKPDGHIWVSHHALDGREGEVTYFVRVECHLGQREAAYVRTPASEVTVRFEQPASLEVMITGITDPALLSQLTVSVAEETDGNHHVGGGESPQGAMTVVAGLQPGPHVVILSLRADRHRTMELARQPIVLASGKNVTTIAAPALHRVGITFEDHEPGSRVHLRADRDRGWSSSWEGTLDANRHVSFDLVPPGRYRVSSSGSGEMEFEVSGSIEVTFQKTERNALRVSTVRPGSYAEEVGFLKGDLVIGVDGQEFENELLMRTVFMGAMGKEQATFVVLRNGSRIQLVVAMKKLMAEESRGLDMQPTHR
ncbi:MAG: hypothetical protein H6834_07150 [Planctomycetes bacterium]|nr:hypothetical protein [Planctomycetota bacterium]MCB9891552.1 hypothetical protein [Planctomycetota bacterium]